VCSKKIIFKTIVTETPVKKYLHALSGISLALTLSFGVATAYAQAPAAAPAAPAAAAAPAPAAPPIWKQGMPASMADSTLAPLPGKLVATKAADVPLDKIKLPPGFKVEVWADSIPGSRAIAEGENGKYYVGTRPLGRIYEVTDNGYLLQTINALMEADSVIDCTFNDKDILRKVGAAVSE